MACSRVSFSVVRLSSGRNEERWTNERKGVASKWLLSMSRVRSLPSRAASVVIIFVSVPIYTSVLDRVANRFHAKANSVARVRGELDYASYDEALIRFLCRVKYAARFTPDFTYRIEMGRDCTLCRG